MTSNGFQPSHYQEALQGCKRPESEPLGHSHQSSRRVWQNYQAHMFNGLYDNYTRPAIVKTEGKVNLIMKWSDDWLSNLNCTADTLLDRGGANGDGISKGWLTNHEEGDYELNGETFHYTYFVKIVYDNGAACTAHEASCIWNVYTVIEEVLNDPNGGATGVNRSTLVNPADLGFYTN